MGEIEEAIEIIESYINYGYKSMYLMDAWLHIKEHLEEENERKNDK